MADERGSTDPDLKRALLYWAFAALLIAVSLYSALVLYFKNDIPEGLKTLLTVVVTTFVMYLKDVFGFYFGSSQGSQTKDAALTASTGALATMAAATAPAMTTTVVTETKATEPLLAHVVAPAPTPAAVVADVAAAIKDEVIPDIKDEVIDAIRTAEPIKATLEVEPKPKDPPHA